MSDAKLPEGVKRYCLSDVTEEGGWPGMAEIDRGAWVRASDYDSLAARLRELEEGVRYAWECVVAADTEGFLRKVNEMGEKDMSDGSIYGIVHRRLLYAFDKLRALAGGEGGT